VHDATCCWLSAKSCPVLIAQDDPMGSVAACARPWSLTAVTTGGTPLAVVRQDLLQIAREDRLAVPRLPIAGVMLLEVNSVLAEGVMLRRLVSAWSRSKHTARNGRHKNEMLHFALKEQRRGKYGISVGCCAASTAQRCYGQ
jgi:hypothetical protein